MTRILAALLALAVISTMPALAGKPPAELISKSKTAEPRVVTFETSDGVKIVSDFYAAESVRKSKAPVAILIHMYPADRASWKPLVPGLLESGFAVLAYDIRGHGESVQPKEMNLKKKYDGRETEHFNNAWRDAAAAKQWLAKQPGCDTSRIVLVGASIGCSVSLDYGSRDDDVKAIVCLSPGTNYFGVDSLDHIKKCAKRNVLLIAPQGEQGSVTKLHAAAGDAVKTKAFPGGRAQHGTRIFAAKYKNRVIEAICSHLRSGVLPKEDNPKDADPLRCNLLIP